MDWETFLKICKDLKEFPETFKIIHLNGFGEPLLNKHIADFVEKIKQEHIAEEVEITTNGSLLTHELSDALVKAGLDKIIFSIYSLKDSGYLEFSNAKASFEHIYNNISYLHSIGGVHIHAKIAGEYFSSQEQDEFVRKFEPIVDSLYIDHAINPWPELKVTDNDTHNVYNLKFENTDRICPMPFYQMVIHSNGKVSPCCVDYAGKAEMGDVHQNSLKEIWNGERYRSLRRDILSDTVHAESVCARCEYPNCGATVDITPYRDDLIKLY
jgi:radical SAM protein with 4Fe4S-binding SPASM domain